MTILSRLDPYIKLIFDIKNCLDLRRGSGVLHCSSCCGWLACRGNGLRLSRPKLGQEKSDCLFRLVYDTYRLLPPGRHPYEPVQTGDPTAQSPSSLVSPLSRVFVQVNSIY